MAIKGPRYNKYLRRDEWGVDYRLGGKNSARRQQWGFESRAQAQLFFDEINLKKQQQKYGLSPVDEPTFRELCVKRFPEITTYWQRQAEAGGQPLRRTRDQIAAGHPRPVYRERQKACRVLTAFLSTLPAPESFRVTQLTSAHFDTFLEKRLAEGITPGTARRELTILSATLHQAQRWFPGLSQWIVPKIFYPKGTKKRRERIIEEDEIARLLGWLLRPKDHGEYQPKLLARRR